MRSRSLFGGPVLSLASQLVGLVQLGLLLLRVGANEATDVYFYLFNMGMLPIQIVIAGMMYPLLLNNDRLSLHSARRIKWLTPVLSAATVIIGSGWLALSDRLHSELLPIAGFILVNAVIQSRLWFRSIAAESGGNPRWSAAIALPANVLATLTLAIPLQSATGTVALMVCALAVGNMAMLLVARKRKIGDDVLNGLPTTTAARSTGTSWFLGRSSVGYIGLAILQSLAVLLPPSAVTLLNLGVKVVGSIASTFVNAIMPAIVHQNTESPAAGRKFLRVLILILSCCSLVGIVGVSQFDSSLTVPAICLGIWVISSASAAVAQRMSFRFLKPKASGITIVAVPAVVVLAALSAQTPGFELVVLLCAYAALDAITAAFLLFTLRDRWMGTATATFSAALAVIWILALTGQV